MGETKPIDCPINRRSNGATQFAVLIRPKFRIAATKSCIRRTFQSHVIKAFAPNGAHRTASQRAYPFTIKGLIYGPTVASSGADSAVNSNRTASRPMQAPTSRPKASAAIPVATVEALPAKVVGHNGFSAFHQLSVTDLSPRDLRTQGTADSVAAKSRWLVARRYHVQQRRRSPYWSK
jgi:hypothetical protein